MQLHQPCTPIWAEFHRIAGVVLNPYPEILGMPLPSWWWAFYCVHCDIFVWNVDILSTTDIWPNKGIFSLLCCIAQLLSISGLALKYTYSSALLSQLLCLCSLLLSHSCSLRCSRWHPCCAAGFPPVLCSSPFTSVSCLSCLLLSSLSLSLSHDVQDDMHALD